MDLHGAWIEELAKNNQRPSEEELQAVRRLIVKPMQDSLSLLPEILDLTNRLVELKIKEKEVEKRISHLNSILSPIRRVPEDVLGEIFYRCLPTHRNSIMKSNDCPMLLTHVCRRWRAVAMASPRLWERVYITFTEDDTTPDIDTAAEMVRNGTVYFQSWQEALSKAEKEHRVKSLRRRYDAVKEWLLRSGARPLSLSISFPTQHWYTVPYSQRPHSVTMEFLSFLASLSPRIKDLELTAPVQIYEALAKMIRVSEMTALTSLRVDYLRGIFERIAPSGASHSLFHAPNLRKVSIVDRHGDENLWGLRDPAFADTARWSKLTTLTCVCVLKIDETFFILENTPNLVHYKGIVAGRGGDDAQPFFHDGHISLPFLRTLSIHDYVKPQRLLGNMYDCIDAPLLQGVSYYVNNEDSTTILPIPIVPLLRKSIHMQKLSINTRNFSAIDLGPLLDTVPTITHLFIGPANRNEHPVFVDQPLQSVYDSRGVRRTQSPWSFRQLVVDQSSNNDPPILPRLTSLTISTPAAQVDADMVFDIVKSRMMPTMSTAALDHVKIRFGHKKTRDIAQELTRHAESLGVKVNLDFKYLPPTPPERNPIHPEFGLSEGLAGRTWRYIDAGMDLEIS